MARIVIEVTSEELRATLAGKPLIGRAVDGTGVHHDLFMAALNTKFREEDPYSSPTVMVRPDGKPGGQVWAYTRKGVTHPPAWLVSLCAFFEDEQGQTAGIRRAW